MENKSFDIEKLVVSLALYNALQVKGRFSPLMFENVVYSKFIEYINSFDGSQKDAATNYFIQNRDFENHIYSVEKCKDYLKIFQLSQIEEEFLKKAAKTLLEKKVEAIRKNGSVSNIEEVLLSIQKEVSKARADRSEKKKKPSETYGEYILNILSQRQVDGVIGIRSGIESLDAITRGFKKSEYIILAGRPSMGKTSIALDFAVNAAKNGHSVLFLSLEMTREQVIGRMISKVNQNIPLSSALYGEDYENISSEIQTALSALDQMMIDIEDFSGYNGVRVETIEKVVEDYKTERGFYPELIILDYIQYIEGDGYDENRSISQISAKISSMRKKTNAAWVVLSQLNRQVDQRNNKRPMPSDLRGSGSLEQDADIILFPYRPLVYMEQKINELLSRKSDKIDELRSTLETIRSLRAESAELIVAKNRNGATGVAKAKFIRETSSFVDESIGFGDNGEDRIF